jgi:hypothetical protein
MTNPQELAERMAAKSDHELLAMFASPEDWTPAAMDAAKAELRPGRVSCRFKAQWRAAIGVLRSTPVLLVPAGALSLVFSGLESCAPPFSPHRPSVRRT